MTHMQHIIAELKETIASLKGQIAYCNEALASNLAVWERKEYEGVKADALAELEAKQNHLNTLEA